VSPTLILLLLVLLVPLAIGVSYSFRHLVVYEPFDAGYVGLANYRELFSDPIFGKTLINTLEWTLGSLIFQFPLGFGLALLLNRPFPGRGLYQAVVFLPWAIPGFLSGLVWSWLFNPIVSPLPRMMASLGLINGVHNILSDPHTAMWGPIIANVWFGIPFFAITLMAALQAIPQELYESSEIDGAGTFSKFFYVTLPFMAPTIAITVMLRTVWIANFPDLIFVMTGGGPANSTQTIATYIFNLAYSKLDFGYASAVATVLLILLVLYAIVVLRLRRGWTLEAAK
jgi:multiple sugar transport system permease protein